MAGWNELGGVLDGAGGAVRLSWSELSRIVGGLPPSAANHRAWWSGNRPHVLAWRAAGYTITHLEPGKEVTFVRSGQPSSGDRTPGAAPFELATDPRTVADLLLITCVKEKLAAPAPARDLYVSALFRKERAYAERLGVPWFILSAEHGLVAPHEWLAPYDRYLPDTPPSYRAAWGLWVAERLELLAGPLGGRVVEVHASAAYVSAIAKHLTAKGARLSDPLQGLSHGRRLAWYNSPDRDSPEHDAEAPDGEGTAHSDTAGFVDVLRTRTSAMTPAEFLERRGAGLSHPGLYSWWVDESGAADLSNGLDAPVSPGLIYAGLAGATRWPSGKRSANTLWSRITSMHLGGNHEFSTFRRTLGAVLANVTHSDRIDEHALTTWMYAHLTIVAVPHDDADTLGRLEADVLRAIDPPLNLQGMDPTPVRRRLTHLRREHRLL